MKDVSLKVWCERLRGLVAGAIDSASTNEAQSKASIACGIMLKADAKLVDQPTTTALLEYINKGQALDACKLVDVNGYRIRPGIAVLLSAQLTIEKRLALEEKYGRTLVDLPDLMRRLYKEARC